MLQGDRIRQSREHLGLSQESLGRLVGKDTFYISKLERGVRTNITTETLEQLATALGCSTDYLLGRADDPRPQTRRRQPLAQAEAV
jgi:transcriptional regulator with XRE-family HTH domain